MSIPPEQQIKGHLDRGRACQERGRLDEAVDEYRAALDIDPDNAEARHGLATALAKKTYWTRAFAEYEAFVSRASDAASHYSLGWLYKKQGYLDNAIAHFQRALQLNPQHAQAHCSLAQIYEGQSRIAEAVAEYKKALRIAPRDRVAREALRRIRGEGLTSAGALDL